VVKRIWFKKNTISSTMCFIMLSKLLEIPTSKPVKQCQQRWRSRNRSSTSLESYKKKNAPIPKPRPREETMEASIYAKSWDNTHIKFHEECKCKCSNSINKHSRYQVSKTPDNTYNTKDKVERTQHKVPRGRGDYKDLCVFHRALRTIGCEIFHCTNKIKISRIKSKCSVTESEF
jgi:hypothetical protein